MSAQIAFTLPDMKKKSLLQKKLAADGLTTKSFFTFCVDGYLNQSIRIGVIPSESNNYENLTSEEGKNLQHMQHLSSFMNHL